MTTSTRPADDTAADQAAANAALAGLTLTAAERNLLERRTRGQVDHGQFLQEAAALATARRRR